MLRKKLFLIIGISVLLLNSLNGSQKELIVGTKVAEPFVIKTDDGKFTGVAIELWQRIADSLNYKYSFKEYDLDGLINAAAQNKIDLGVSPMTVTAEREQKLDFSQPYFISGLSIATKSKDGGGLFAVFKGFLSIEFLEVLALLVFILFLVGLLAWFFERKKNSEEFGDGAAKGIGAGFWWAAVTMTTVGYGDKSPKTLGGRIIALIWMFAALIIISSITAAITSALTVNQLDSKVKEFNDLYKVSVGTIEFSSSRKFLETKNIRTRDFEKVTELVNAIKSGEIDAAVYDTPILKYMIKKENLENEIKLLPSNLESQYYGFILPSGSELQEAINVELLSIINKPEWKQNLKKYFGE